jgi:hypothetical protein
MKNRVWMLWVACGSFALLGGWHWLEERRTELLIAPAGTLPPLDYLVPAESFSHVENTKRNLDALCVRLRLEVQLQILTNDGLIATNRRSSPGAHRWEDPIRDLERGMHEFQGTDRELFVAQDLLFVLKKAERYERWMEVYLKALYEQPTHPVVASFAREALVIGRLIGREQEVLAGLNHLRAIPFDFENKALVEAVLLDTKEGLLSGKGKTHSTSNGSDSYTPSS